MLVNWLDGGLCLRGGGGRHVLDGTQACCSCLVPHRLQPCAEWGSMERVGGCTHGWQQGVGEGIRERQQEACGGLIRSVNKTEEPKHTAGSVAGSDRDCDRG